MLNEWCQSGISLFLYMSETRIVPPPLEKVVVLLRKVRCDGNKTIKLMFQHLSYSCMILFRFIVFVASMNFSTLQIRVGIILTTNFPVRPIFTERSYFIQFTTNQMFSNWVGFKPQLTNLVQLKACLSNFHKWLKSLITSWLGLNKVRSNDKNFPRCGISAEMKNNAENGI